MGRPNSGRSDERPETQVRISRGVWMDKYEVTLGQWEAAMGDKPRPRAQASCSEPECPVHWVTWKEVQEFIAKLNERERGTGYEYRLPTEAEWEYTARAGTIGNNYGDLDLIAWYGGNSLGRPYPVGQKEPNAFGLHDMTRNVSEWVGDWYGAHPGETVTDPQGPSTGSHRVFRGCDYGHNEYSCRVGYRFPKSPSSRDDDLGCHLVRVE